MKCHPDQSRGGCVPVIRYESDESCDGPAGGTKTVGTPKFVPVVQNEGDLIWRDEDYVPIQSDDDGTVYIFDNI